MKKSGWTTHARNFGTPRLSTRSSLWWWWGWWGAARPPAGVCVPAPPAPPVSRYHRRAPAASRWHDAALHSRGSRLCRTHRIPSAVLLCCFFCFFDCFSIISRSFGRWVLSWLFFESRVDELTRWVEFKFFRSGFHVFGGN